MSAPLPPHKRPTTPKIVSEFRAKTRAGVAPGLMEGGGITGVSPVGNPRMQMFRLFTVAFTAVVTTAVFFSIPDESTYAGVTRPHVFTDVKREVRRQRDAFFGVDDEQTNSK